MPDKTNFNLNFGYGFSAVVLFNLESMTIKQIKISAFSFVWSIEVLNNGMLVLFISNKKNQAKLGFVELPQVVEHRQEIANAREGEYIRFV